MGSIISPKLTEWIGLEMQKEALVAKERRKAREEGTRPETSTRQSEVSPVAVMVSSKFCCFSVYACPNSSGPELRMLRRVGVTSSPCRRSMVKKVPVPDLTLATGTALPMKGSVHSTTLLGVLIQVLSPSRVFSIISDAYREASSLEGVAGCDEGVRVYARPRACIYWQIGRSALAKENISWPEVESSPVDVLGCLPRAARERLGAWRKHMLLSESQPSQEIEHVVPYIDPVLKHSPAEYAGFVIALEERSMIRYQLAGDCESLLGVFFVYKKSGQPRLIFDTRKLNQMFSSPPDTGLPSADAFTRVEMPENRPFLIAFGDLANAFYT